MYLEVVVFNAIDSEDRDTASSILEKLAEHNIDIVLF